jgi:acyl-CoA synthetase (AMP-forming)/AMP-acid ligase II
VAVAFVVPRPGRTPSPEALRRFCRERLAGYKTPRTVTVCRELPRNALGKLLRDRLGA